MSFIQFQKISKFSSSLTKQQNYLAYFLIFLLFFFIFPLSKIIFIPGLFNSFKIKIFIFIFEINSLSSLFSIMTIFIFYIGVISSWNFLIKNFNFTLLINLSLFFFSSIASFVSYNLFTFYFFFELSSIPILYLIYIYGKRNRKVKAAQMYLAFTLLGSIIMFLVLLIEKTPFSNTNNTLNSTILLVFLITAFFIKLPIFPFYLWLPEAHVESPTIGSIFLAGISLKLGGFGILKFVLPNLTAVKFLLTWYIIPLLVCSLVFSSIAAIVVHDLKKIVAYSSISHMSLFTINLIICTEISKIGSIIGMIAHSLTACSLFLIAGILYDKFKTRNSLYFSGLILFMPFCGFFLILNILSNISFPGSLSFVAELIIFYSIMSYSLIFLLILLSLNSLVAVFSFKIIKLFYFGNVSIYSKFKFKDISRKDFWLLTYFIVPQLFFGFFPNNIVEFINF